MPRLQLANIMQQLSSMMPVYCDKCGTRHSKEDMEIISDAEDRILLRLECSNCKNIYLFQINSLQDGVFNAKRAILKSDVNTDEIRKFSGSEKILNDEVLDVFIALKNVTNLKDFEILFDAQENS